MNIKQAKEQIKNAMTAYFTKDDLGEYVIPSQKQRPVFLMGPPGIGKTAIMEQVAQELGVGLVSYSMTHHTRQSALGLPFISRKTYDGKEYDVSEYTMSEIIATVYDTMEHSGIREGILFLDEINCVSETLTPVMLQFLQYKVFGRHQVPRGWLVVTAGNPPEYNNSVREFDIVTWDRLKRIDVEPDFDCWKEYAYQKGVHPAVMTYVEIKKADFYGVESSVGGKRFVTARGWDDLSAMIQLYERNGLPVDLLLIQQYLQHPKISRDFASYYDLFNKYRGDYQVEKILAGTAAEEILERAKSARFDERLALLGLMLDALNNHLRKVMETEQVLLTLLNSLKKVREGLTRLEGSSVRLLETEIQQLEKKLDNSKAAQSLSAEDRRIFTLAVQNLTRQKLLIADISNGKNAFAVLKKDFDALTANLKKQAGAAGKQLSNAFQFCEQAFGDGQEMLIFVTELTIGYHSAKFISRYGCKEYFQHNQDLLFYERQKEIIIELEQLNLDE